MTSSLAPRLTIGEASPCQDDGVDTCLYGAVTDSPMQEGEALPALSSLPGEELCGRGLMVTPHKEETLAVVKIDLTNSQANMTADCKSDS